MFAYSSVAPVEYHNPWDLPFSARLSLLRRKERRIAYYYATPDNSTFRYRAFNMVQALTADGASGVSAGWFHRGDLPFMESVLENVDALVFCRTLHSPAIGQLVNLARERGVQLLFDVDDLVFDTEFTELVLNTLDQDTTREALLTEWYGYFARHGTLLKLCDRAVTTNAFLAGKIKDFAPHLEVGVVPNFLERRQQEISAQLFERKRSSGFASDGHFHIGYFSGTPSHQRDFAVAAPALARILDSERSARLTLVGYLEPSPVLERFRDRIDRVPLQDYLNLQRIIAQTEINIAPLVDNTFTNCKSELKFFEAAICGTVTVASPTFCFRNAITDGDNGFLARSYEWENKLWSAIALLQDRARYEEMASVAQRYAEAHYGWNRHAATIESAVFGA
ncbi:glycosyltransferase [Chitinasiproducens palmae]|uniref:Glycosyl transferases group 1 n=1 Tax=Chitinasiproducens palmae TaxID=1770053 RepID=A0A1H2PSZ9_9BURK|nr:glycosyltransferase [Chitinasiproducens palmae]SDV50162.1 Glycosyl transferases group 1 [Chitinasiproducens palmae]